MSKHCVIFYTKLKTPGDYDYADNFSQGELLNHRPMKGDVVCLVSLGYPQIVVEIEDLILLRETASPEEITYWHAYCREVEIDFSASPYFGKSGDLGKLAAHALDQRATQAGKYGQPPNGYDRESYKQECRRIVDDLCQQYVTDRSE